MAEKKRKWDVAAPPPPPTSADPAAAIQSAAKKLNAMWSTPLDTEREFDINSLHPNTRQFLCKGTTHEAITAATGAILKVKGVHVGPGEQSDEKPLHLNVSGPSIVEVESAIAKLNDIVERDRERPRSDRFESGNRFGGAGNLIQEKVQINMPTQNIMGRLLGPKGAYVKHIVTQSGAKVQLRGRYSGYLEGPEQKEADEPLHFMITAPKQEAVDHAKGLCNDLLDTVAKDRQNPRPYNPAGPPGASYGAPPPQAYGQPAYGQQPAYPAQAYPGYPPQAPVYGAEAYGAEAAPAGAYPPEMYAAYGYNYPGYGYPQQPPQAYGYPYAPQAEGVAPGAEAAPVDPNAQAAADQYAAYYQEYNAYYQYYNAQQPPAAAPANGAEIPPPPLEDTSAAQQNNDKNHSNEKSQPPPPPPPAETKDQKTSSTGSK